ncbi:phosphoribosyl 1,2-cyclic phosphate phosphodiesterase [Lacibacter cauensis]|uniref:Phosphoribosyl 1,2-cyclic phosphate phosphodiesterase n=1 Tax=Lacibacter cauensis TaxID=510947 RepID=A0A562SR18_9BACT|nr:MBL fold metallo-hydrolase [Lacibacter cauensis]TWI83707.1 phosphoribosyl 1,2-cyclic phosphate phosphodiesterase [Lacibacter cauensis]
MSYPPIKITFLGTGTSSGVPMIGCDCDVCTSSNKKDNRLRSSIMVETADTTIVVDTTPDFRYQMLRLGVKKIDAIIFTHPHKDHIAGLDDVRAFNYINRKPMEVYCNYLTEEALRRDFYYAFSDTRYPGVPEINLNTITDQPFTINELLIEPVLVWHMKMPVLGFRFGPFTYITDANFIEPAEQQKIKGSEVMVVNALRKEKHISHYNLEEAVALVQELEVPQAYFTHISHQLGLHDVVEKELPKGIHLAFDGLVLHL